MCLLDRNRWKLNSLLFNLKKKAQKFVFNTALKIKIKKEIERLDICGQMHGGKVKTRQKSKCSSEVQTQEKYANYSKEVFDDYGLLT